MMLTFAEASADGTLDALLDKKLEEAYPDVRKKNSAQFQSSTGAWRPLAEVKDNVGAYLYADLLKSIEISAKETGVDWPSPAGNARFSEPLELYAQHRLQPHVQEALDAISRGDGEEGWIAGDSSVRISEQWRLVKREKEMTRSQVQALHLAQLFELPVSTWSSVVALQPNRWGFVRTLEKKKDEKSDTEALVKAGQERLGNEAKRAALQALLTDIAAKKAIVFAPSDHAEKML
jgi:hypothetical protein